MHSWSVAPFLTWFIAVILLAAPAKATELGNIFGTEEAEAQSQEAGVLAIEGIQQFFDGILQRESGLGSGFEEISASIELLDQSVVIYEGLLESGSESFSLSEAQVEQVSTATGGDFQSAYPEFFTRTDDFNSLLFDFVQLGYLLQDVLKENLSEDLDEPIYPKVALVLATYLRVGGLVTEISRSRSRDQ